MTEGKIVVCPQCGKKYKLKAGFDAASFSCNACGATVWVKKKASGTPVSGRRRRPGAGRGGGGRKAAAGAARGRAPARGRGRRREEEPAEEGGGRYSSRYSKKDNSATVIMAIVGVVVIAGIIFFVATSGKDKEETAKLPDTPVTDTDTDTGTGGGETKKVTGGNDEDLDLSKETKNPGTSDDTTKKDDGGGTDEPRKEADTKPSKKLGGGSRKKTDKGRSRWDPPADLGHVKGTTPEQRKKIDDLITTMMDFDAGRDSLDAKEALIAIGKPAFPRILGAMAKIRDTITDVDSGDERLIESSLKLADEALREMDGWLTAKGKSTLRPGSEKRYIAYICRLHYKRWQQKLKDMPEMPGPFDPSQEYDGEAEEYRGGK